MDQELAFSYRGTNLGDDIQTIAALRFLKGEPSFIERDSLANTKEEGRLILNGWWSHDPFGAWPPPEGVRALPVSMHITPRARLRFANNDSLDWFRNNGPVGARDLETLAWMRSVGIDAYWSGCLTLTIQRPDVPNGDKVLLVDLKKPHIRAVEEAIGPCEHLTHSTPITDPKERQEAAQSLLRTYASAELVVTTRLHVALPCAAMGTPVVLVGDNIRFAGLDRTLRMSDSASLPLTVRAELDHPKPRDPELLDITAALIERCNAFMA